jgi:hypothetical protein
VRGGPRKAVRKDDGRKSYTDGDRDFIAACRNRTPPVKWDKIAKALGRTLQSVHDFWERRGNKFLAGPVSEDMEAMADCRIAVLGEWPRHARFDGARTYTMKPLYRSPAPTTPACFLPRAQQLPGASAPGFSIQLPAASNAPPIPGRGPEAGSATSPLAEPARLSTGAE